MARAGDRPQKLILGHAKVNDTATPEQASAMLDEMLSIQAEELKIKQTYAKKLRKARTTNLGGGAPARRSDAPPVLTADLSSPRLGVA